MKELDGEDGQKLSADIQSGAEAAVPADEDRNLKWYAAREPLVLLVLSLLAVVSFLAVAGLAKIYFREQHFLGDRWFGRGAAALKSGQSEQAVNAFQSALRYSPNDYTYQLNLAQALAALKRTDEAEAYLLSLWEREPENGETNLALGRIYAGKGDTDEALRHYHNAIYAAWPSDPDGNRRIARLELIDFLQHENAVTQAQSELIALAANLPANSPLHLRAANLFVQVQDNEHALAEYRAALRVDRRNSNALSGAGRAAFDLARYEAAQRYLEDAVAANPLDTQSADLLRTTTLVLQMDPFRRQASVSKRNRTVVEAFEVAGQRVNACPAGAQSSVPQSSETQSGSPAHSERVSGENRGDQGSLVSRWHDLKPSISDRSLRQNPDLVDTAMDLVFAIERQTSSACAAPTAADQALLLIAKLHGGN